MKALTQCRSSPLSYRSAMAGIVGVRVLSVVALARARAEETGHHVGIVRRVGIGPRDRVEIAAHAVLGQWEIDPRDRVEIAAHAVHGQWEIDQRVRRVPTVRDQRARILEQPTEQRPLRPQRRHPLLSLVLPRASRGDAKPCYWHRHVINTASSIAVV